MTMPLDTLSKRLLLPELKLLRHESLNRIFCEKTSEYEVCCRCATLSKSVYDHRWVKVKDAPIRGTPPVLMILKRRFWCKPCQKPFTEPIRGILPRRRTTQRFRTAVLKACEQYQNLSQVRMDFKVSSDFVYRIVYEQLELKRRMNNQYAWPKAIGIDEHGIGKDPTTGRRRFASLIVNQNKGKLMEVVIGKSTAELANALKDIPGRANVRIATMDMCDPYRNFVKLFFPNAHIVADKFHVLRLLSASILRERKKIAGNRASRKARGLLLMSSKNLDYFARLAIDRYLENYPTLKELYDFKEALHSFYRIKNQRQAALVLDSIIITSQISSVPEILTLGKTLQKWKVEILNYFHFRITNARLEGFNNKASLVRRRGYGYKNTNNYRLQLLNACS